MILIRFLGQLLGSLIMYLAHGIIVGFIAAVIAIEVIETRVSHWHEAGIFMNCISNSKMTMISCQAKLDGITARF